MMRSKVWVLSLGVAVLSGYAVGCANSADDCKRTATCKPEGSAGGAGGGTETSSTTTSNHKGGSGGVQSATTVGGTAGESGSSSEGGTAGASSSATTQPCNGECTGSTPVCNEATNTCVACLTSSDCTEDFSRSVCNAVTHACVACLSNGDCVSATASRCDISTNTCTACSEDKDCEQITGRNVCLIGDATLPNQCVQCTGKKYAACGKLEGSDLVCDSDSHRCSTDTKVASATECRPCIADAQCQAGQLCAQQMYEGKLVGNFCFWKQGDVANKTPEKCFATDNRPYVNVAKDVVSVDGETATLCTLRAVTTCAALNQFSTEDCAPAGVPDDQFCGSAPGKDSKCVETSPGAGTYRCTTACGSDYDCKPGFSCNATTNPDTCTL
jgi:hypothetical protein